MKRSVRWLAVGIATSAVACVRVGEKREFVEGTIPKSLRDVILQIRDGALGDHYLVGSTVNLRSKRSPMPEVTRDHRTFSVANWMPSDEDLRERSWKDPAMDRYLRLPPKERRRDIHLSNILSEWYSEYAALVVPLPFRCDFILHLSEVGPGETRVEVLEYYPHVRFGSRPGVGHGGFPGLIPNLIVVSPTTSDRVEMLERVQSLASVAPGLNSPLR